MLAVKKEAIDIIKKLPDDCSYEDIQYHFYVIQKIKSGINSAKNGKTVSNKEAKKRMERWLTN